MSEIDDARFLAHLDASSDAVMVAANWLRDMGFPVRINPTFKRPSRDLWKQYADGGDLEIAQRIEIKHRPNITFTGAEDFPFKDIIVCARHSFDNARPKPYAYVHLSADYSHAAIVFGKDCKQWRVETIKDRRYDEMTQECYVADLSSVRWKRISKVPA